ncbi:MAG: hypothetical protein JWR84_3555 [Caulobacter sp.]|nr:hypothetical protein [Caulobacter sp.]
MSPAEMTKETAADRDARIRRKNRKLIPWIIAACFAPFVVLALLMLAILGPALIKVDRIMREQPTAERPAN